jgi:hypothetical protein
MILFIIVTFLQFIFIVILSNVDMFDLLINQLMVFYVHVDGKSL